MERPSWSTSGGQFAGASSCAVGLVVDDVGLSFFVIAAQDANEVHDRQLY